MIKRPLDEGLGSRVSGQCLIKGLIGVPFNVGLRFRASGLVEFPKP